MKKLFTLVISIVVMGSPLFSQIVINTTDMPHVGDTLRESQTNVAPAGYSKTGMDTIWNFSSLQALSQRIDTFASVASTPWAYQLFFAGANLATPLTGSPIPGLPVTQGYTFFKNSSASYSEMGSAYTVQNLPLPAKYDNPDIHYEFPMAPGNTWSSTAAFSINVPNLAYFSTHRYRTNIVDGWGLLTTPYGTFQTLRVKSTLLEHDSVYIDSLSTGFPFNRNIIQYIWLGKGKSVPLLQVNEEGTLVTTSYRDFYRMSAKPLSATLGHDTAVFMGSSITLHATVTGGTPPYQILWNTLDTGKTLTVTVQAIKTYSIVVIDALQNFASAQVIVSIRYPPGIAGHEAIPLVCYPNPTPGPIRITLPVKGAPVLMQVFTSRGAKIRECHENPQNSRLSENLSDLPDGLYFIRVTDENSVFSGKVQVIH